MTQTNAGAGTGAAATTEPPQSNEMVLHTGSLSFSSHMSKEDEEMTRSALSAFKAKEDEIDKRRMEVRERIQAQLGRVEEETRRLSTLREVSFYSLARESFLLLRFFRDLDTLFPLFCCALFSRSRIGQSFDFLDMNSLCLDGVNVKMVTLCCGSYNAGD